MKYKNYLWIVFIFVAVCMIYGVFQYLKPTTIVANEGFMTDAEYLEEINHRIKSIQTIRGSIVSSLDALDNSAKESCDLSIKYRDAYIAATAALPKYQELKPEERLQNAKEDYMEEKTRFASQNTPIYECFENPPPAPAAAAAPLTPVQEAQMKLMAEIQELNKVLASRRLRIAKDKGKLVQGLQEFNSTFSGTQLMNEGTGGAIVPYAAAPVASVPTVQAAATPAAAPAATPAAPTTKIKVAYIGSEATLKDINDGLEELNEQNNIEMINITKKDNFDDIKYPEYKVLYVDGPVTYTQGYDRMIPNTKIHKFIVDFVKSGVNVVFNNIWNINKYKTSTIDNLDYIKYTSFKADDFGSSAGYNKKGITISKLKNHPILQPDIVGKQLPFDSATDIKTQDNDHIIANDLGGVPLIGVRTRGSTRYVSLNIFVTSDIPGNLISQKLFARCVLWAAGRI